MDEDVAAVVADSKYRVDLCIYCGLRSGIEKLVELIESVEM